MTADLETAMANARPRVEVTTGPAQRPLDSLSSQRGYVVVHGTPTRPEVVRICPWVSPTYWRRVSAGGGDKATFERTDAPNPVLIIDQDGEYLAGGGR